MRALLMTKNQYKWQPSANTLAYYEFENNTTDLSGNNVSCNLRTYQSNPQYGEIGGQYYLSGYNWATIGIDSSFYNNDFTLSFWCKIPSGANNYNEVLGNIISATGYVGAYFVAYNNEIHLGTSDNGGVGLSTPTSFSFTLDGQWHHFNIHGQMRRQQEIGLYIDGQEATLITRYNGGATIDIGYIRLGGFPVHNTDTYYVDYCFDKVIFENRIWSVGEDMEYYNSTKNIYQQVLP